jgi:glyoxylase-like metal-dependent hydrolase (beta-lactamase superfamily II)
MSLAQRGWQFRRCQSFQRRRRRPQQQLEQQQRARSLFTNNMKIVPVPVREDNYAYLLIDDSTQQAAVVDPYDVPKVQSAAKDLGVTLMAAITTHHHFDHSGGNQVPIAFTEEAIRQILISPLSF